MQDIKVVTSVRDSRAGGQECNLTEGCRGRLCRGRIGGKKDAKDTRGRVKERGSLGGREVTERHGHTIAITLERRKF